MKRTLTLFLALLSISFLSFGQKQMTASTVYEMNEDGSILYIDSTNFFYNNLSLGVLHEFQPKFSFSSFLFDFVLPDDEEHFLIHSDSNRLYDGQTLPLSFSESTVNTIANDRVTAAVEGPYSKHYTYDLAGNMISYVDKYFNGSTVQSYDSVVYTYDLNSNRTSKSDYSLANGTELFSVDSMFYAAGTNQLIEYRNYDFNSNSNALELNLKTEASYSGQQIQSVKLYFGSGGSEIWVNDIQFVYSGNTPTGFIIYEVVNNVPTSTQIATANYLFDAQNQLIESSLQSGTDTVIKTQFQYDTDGFVTKKKQFDLNSNDELYVYLTTSYFFKSTLNLAELAADNIVLYPNPANEMLTIQTEALLQEVSVYNLNGQVLIHQNSKIIDLSGLESGTYLITGKTDLGYFTKKITSVR